MARARRVNKNGKPGKFNESKAAGIRRANQDLGYEGIRDAKTAARAALVPEDQAAEQQESNSGLMPDQNRYADFTPHDDPSRYPGVRITGPLVARFYADDDDAVTALKLVQAIQDFFYDAKAESVRIDLVERGSVIARIVGWWNQEDNTPFRTKMYDLGTVGEQWGKDVTANKARAEVAAMNASTTGALLASVDPYDNIAMHVDNFLIIKTTGKDGRVNAVVRTLGFKAMKALEDNPAVLNDPTQTLEQLAVLSYANDNDLSLES